MDKEPPIKTARNHVASGQHCLAMAEKWADLRTPFATLATAHFSAAMAITNILLADPAEAPEALER